MEEKRVRRTYEPEFKLKVAQAFEEAGGARTYLNVAEQFGVDRNAVEVWWMQYKVHGGDFFFKKKSTVHPLGQHELEEVRTHKQRIAHIEQYLKSLDPDGFFPGGTRNA